jgi:hypothetical protein
VGRGREEHALGLSSLYQVCVGCLHLRECCLQRWRENVC